MSSRSVFASSSKCKHLKISSKMKSQAIIDKVQAKLASIDPAKRTTFLIFQFHFNNADGTLLKSVVLDLKNTKIYEGTVDNADGEITIADDDFVAWATKQVPYTDLLPKVKVAGNREAIKSLMHKFHDDEFNA